MTALVFTLEPDKVCLAMDTLVVASDDKLPLSFQRKFLSLPDSDLLVSGTGFANFINGWFDYLSNLACVGNIDDLNQFAPAVLKASFEACEYRSPPTVSIYHFGFSRSAGKYLGYVYRSTNGFPAELLQYGLGLKPPVPVPPADDILFPDFLVDIILRQQRSDSLLPIEQQLGIGGEIEFAVLSQRSTQIGTVHRFASYEHERTIIARRGEA